MTKLCYRSVTWCTLAQKASKKWSERSCCKRLHSCFWGSQPLQKECGHLESLEELNHYAVLFPFKLVVVLPVLTKWTLCRRLHPSQAFCWPHEPLSSFHMRVNAVQISLIRAMVSQYLISLHIENLHHIVLVQCLQNNQQVYDSKTIMAASREKND